MKVGKILKSVASPFIGFVKRHPKAAATLLGTVIGGTVGAKVKNVAIFLPDDTSPLSRPDQD